MIDLSFTLRAITPLFLGGANPLGDPESRSQTLIGGLRWWCRALYGGLSTGPGGSVDVQTVRKLDLATFGAPGWRRPAGISLAAVSPLLKQSFDPPTYGVAIMTGQGRKNRPYFDVGSTFRLEFRRISEHLAYRWLASLWCLTTLGGLGSGKHRGFGRIQVTETDPRDLNSLLPSTIDGGSIRWGDLFAPYLPNDLASIIRRNLQALRKFAQRDLPDSTLSPLSTIPEFPVIAPNYWRMRIVGESYKEIALRTGSPLQALDSAGRFHRAWREARDREQAKPFSFKKTPEKRWHTVDYLGGVSDYLSGKEPPTEGYKLTNFVLGVPHPFFRTTGGRKASIVGRDKGRDRYSPVWWPIFSAADGKCFVGLSVFISQFIPDGVQLSGGRHTARIHHDPVETIIGQFFDSFAGPEIHL